MYNAILPTPRCDQHLEACHVLTTTWVRTRFRGFRNGSPRSSLVFFFQNCVGLGELAACSHIQIFCEFVASHDQRTVKERSLRSGRLVGISQQLLISPTAFVVVTDLADVRGRHPLPQGYIGDCQADKCIFCFSPHRIVSFFPSFSTLNLCTIYHHGPTRLFQRSAGLISIHLIHLRHLAS